LAQIDRYKLPIRAARKGPTMEHQDFAAIPPQADLDAQPLDSVMTLHELLAHRRVRGLSVGQCVDGSPLPTGVYAHAHQYPKDSNRGWVCIRSPRDILRRGSREISTTVMHGFAHLLAAAGHDDDWRRTMRELGQPIPAAYRKRNRPSKLSTQRVSKRRR